MFTTNSSFIHNSHGTLLRFAMMMHELKGMEPCVNNIAARGSVPCRCCWELCWGPPQLCVLESVPILLATSIVRFPDFRSASVFCCSNRSQAPKFGPKACPLTTFEISNFDCTSHHVGCMQWNDAVPRHMTHCSGLHSLSPVVASQSAKSRDIVQRPTLAPPNATPPQRLPATLDSIVDFAEKRQS